MLNKRYNVTLRNRFRICLYTFLFTSAILVFAVNTWFQQKDDFHAADGTIYNSRKLQEYRPEWFRSSADLYRRQLTQDPKAQTPTPPSQQTNPTAQPLTESPTFSSTVPSISTFSSQYTTTPSNKSTTNKTRNATVDECDMPAIAEFPGDLFTQKQRIHGAFLVHAFIAIYMCIALAVICDYYFVPSLEVVCYRLDLQADVAGASLMAIGSSAPELFASVIGVFVTKGDIGIGTILGSAIFNVLLVIGLCGVLTGFNLELAWWPLMRDGMCYAFSLVILAIVIVDERVGWLEAVIMLVFYLLYLVLMWKNERLEKWFYLYAGLMETYEKRFGALEEEANDEEDEEEHKLTEKERKRHEKYLKIGKEGVYHPLSHTDSEMSSEDSIDAVYPDDDPFVLTDIPSRWTEKIVWAFLLPIRALFYITVPDIRYKSMRRFFYLTFFMSIVWIGVTTYILVWMTTVVGFTFSIPDAVMGLTFIAFGSSVPDAFASIIVAQQGKGDMAVSQAMGSNVFDILLGLGLPWILKTLIFDPDSIIEVQSVGLIISCFAIFISVLFVIGCFYYYEFKLTKKIGWAFIVAYFVVLLISVLLELFLWNNYHLPTCKYF